MHVVRRTFLGPKTYIAETRATVMQIWIDDIAVGTSTRIGCPAP